MPPSMPSVGTQGTPAHLIAGLGNNPRMQRLNPTNLQGESFLMPPSMPSVGTQGTPAHLIANLENTKTGSSKHREPKTASKQPEEVRSKSTSKGKGQGSKKANAK